MTSSSSHTDSRWAIFQQHRSFAPVVLLTLLAILIVSALFAIGTGTVDLSPQQVIYAIFGPEDYQWHRVVWNIRLPRVLLAGLVGMCLAASGTMLQAIMGNPLADPGIIGISAGAGLFGITILLVFPQLFMWTPVFAFVGAMAAAMIIYILAWKGGIQPIRVILAGVAVSALCGAGISAIMVLFSDRVQGAILFMNGSLSMRSWREFNLLLPYAIVALTIALFCVRRLDLIVLGDDIARSLGMNVQANRLAMTAIAALLAAGAVSAVGLLSFVGLIVPHMMRMIVGTSHRILLPASILGGGALVILSDTLARTLFSPTDLPVGIVMAVIGVPFFLFLLRRSL